MKILHVVNGTIISKDGYAQRVKRQLLLWNKNKDLSIYVFNFLNWRKLLSKDLYDLIKKTKERLCELNIQYLTRIGLPLIVFSYNPDIYFKYCAHLIQRILKKEGINSIYAENLICGYMAYQLKQITKVHYYLDYHGTAPEEFRLSGNTFWNVNYKYYKKIEKLTIENSDGIVCVSDAFKKYILSNFTIDDSKIFVIPSCIEMKHIGYDESVRESLRQQLNIIDKKVIIYAGGLGLWHCSNEMIFLFKKLHEIDKNFFFIFLTHDGNHRYIYNSFKKFGVDHRDYMISSVNHDEIYNYYMAADIGIIIRNNSLINKVSSPTKIPEYLSSGLTLLATNNIGDISKIPTNKILLPYDEILNDDFDFEKIYHKINNMPSRRENYIRCHSFLRDNYVWDKMESEYSELFKLRENFNG